MAYGEIKADTITFTDGGIDKSVSISGLVQNPTFSGNITVTGTISGDTLRGQTISGVTVTGTTAQFTSGTFISLTGTTTQGTTSTYTTGSFTSLTGTTTTGTTASFATGVFTSITGTTATITSGIFASGTAAAPSVSVGTTDNGLYSPGADQVAISTNGQGRLFVDANGKLGLGTSSPSTLLHLSSAPVAASPVPTELRIASTTVSSSWSTTDPWGRISFYAEDPTAGGPKIHGAIDCVAFSAPLGSSHLVFKTTSNSTDTLSEAMRITHEGYVGIGTTSPSGILHLSTTGTTRFFIEGSDGKSEIRANNGNLSLFTNQGADVNGANNTIFYRNGNNESARIDSSGRLLVGTSSALSNVYIKTSAVAPALQIFGTSGSTSSFCITRGTGAASNLVLQRGQTGGGAGDVVADDPVGQINFNGFDGTNYRNTAQITSEVDGTPGAGDMPGRLVFSTTADGSASPTERMRITHEGKVGIGTTSPVGLLNVSSGASVVSLSANADELFISNNGNAGMTIGASENSKCTIAFAEQGVGTDRGKIVYDTNDESLQFFAANAVSERARIDSSGKLLVGTSTAIEVGGINGVVQLEGTQAITSTLSILRHGSGTQGAFIVLGKTRGTSIGANTLVLSGDMLGEIRFAGADGSDINPLGAVIECRVDGTAGSNEMPGRLMFSTNSGATGTDPVERMRITSDGELLVGYTSDNGNYKLQVNSQIFATSATIATSDGRYKENVASLGGCLDLVKALRPVSFTWKPQEDITRIDDEGNEVLVREGHNFPEGTQVGFIAQEVQEVLDGKPWLSSVIKENVRPAVKDNEGNELAPEERFYGIAEGNLIAVLTNALQEAVGRIETLEAEVAALEGN